MAAPDPDLRAAAERVFSYLAATDLPPAEPVEAALGFGMFDITLASFCGELYAQGRARRIVFIGGVGAGTADLGKPEADAWRAELWRTHPAIRPEHVILENRSTNTAENIAFTADLLARRHPELAFGRGLRRALVVASPSRLRRVGLTLRLKQPEVRVFRALPSTSFAREETLYASKGIDYTDHLLGELDRIVDYPVRGWIAVEPLPPGIAADRARLRAAADR